ncbi:MAG: 50S ribosomal protein L6 [Candidatus Peribacteria bacterium]|nr:MAG: 50S ribosomal protein L6 [Candidatus Peribacteria bacterium]
MSRIGKLPIDLTDGATVAIAGSSIKVTGPKGSLDLTLLEGVFVRQEENQILVSIEDDKSLAYWGLTRSLLANMVEGVTKGFSKKLQVLGVGYNAKVQGKTLVLNLGYSHPINHSLPQGIDATVEKDPKGNDMVVLSGIDKQLVGEQAAKIRGYRKPEPYKGK